MSEAVPGNRGLADALRKARIAEAARLEAVLDIRDAQTLRLQALKDDLEAVLAATPDRQVHFDLAVVPGSPPRLWIDLVLSVAMEPDPQTFRLSQDTDTGREHLLETMDRTEIVERIKQQMAHRVIARERQLKVSGTDGQSLSVGVLVLVWLLGFTVGALAALALQSAGVLPVTF